MEWKLELKKRDYWFKVFSVKNLNEKYEMSVMKRKNKFTCGSVGLSPTPIASRLSDFRKMKSF